MAHPQFAPRHHDVMSLMMCKSSKEQVNIWSGIRSTFAVKNALRLSHRNDAKITKQYIWIMKDGQIPDQTLPCSFESHMHMSNGPAVRTLTDSLARPI